MNQSEPPLPQTPSSLPVAIFWDYENIRVPESAGVTGWGAVSLLRTHALKYGHVASLKCYMDTNFEQSSVRSKTRSELQTSGVSIIDTPHNGGKEVADKMILVDLMTFAIDTKAPATVILISGDKDFAYALATLRNRRYKVIVMCNEQTTDSLREQADEVVDWRVDVLKLAPRSKAEREASEDTAYRPKSYKHKQKLKAGEQHKPHLYERPAKTVKLSRGEKKRHAAAADLDDDGWQKVPSFIASSGFPVPQPHKAATAPDHYKAPHHGHANAGPSRQHHPSAAPQSAAHHNPGQGSVWAHSKSGESWGSRAVRSQQEPVPKKAVEVIELSDSDDDDNPLVRIDVAKARELEKVDQRKGKERAVEEPVEPELVELDAGSDIDNTSATAPSPPSPPPLRSMPVACGKMLVLDEDDEMDTGDEFDDEVESAAVNGLLVSRA